MLLRSAITENFDAQGLIGLKFLNRTSRPYPGLQQHRTTASLLCWRPQRALRGWLLVMSLVVSALSGGIAWELINPVTMVQRALVFGMGFAWAIVAAVFLFDLLVSRRGWCGHLCPVGAFYGLLGKRAVIRVAAHAREACTDCGDCFAVCPEPQVITPALRGTGSATRLVLDSDCTNCGRCIDVCADDVFKFSLRPTYQGDRQAAPATTQ